MDENAMYRMELVMSQAGVDLSERRCVQPALDRARDTGAPATAIELEDGTIVTGKTSPLLGATSAALLNALKYLAGIDDAALLISPAIIEPIQALKWVTWAITTPACTPTRRCLPLPSVPSPTPRRSAPWISSQSSRAARPTPPSSSPSGQRFAAQGRHPADNGPVYQSKKQFHKQ